MLAMMVAACSFSACDSDDDDMNQKGKATLIIDGKAYYTNPFGEELVPNLHQYNDGLFFYIEAFETPSSFFPDKILEFYYFGCSKVANLKVGDTFAYEDLYINRFENGNIIPLYENEYEIIDGSITVLSVDSYRVKIKINDLKFSLESSTNMFGEDYEPKNPKTHIVSGTVQFSSGAIYNDGSEVPFF